MAQVLAGNVVTGNVVMTVDCIESPISGGLVNDPLLGSASLREHRNTLQPPGNVTATKRRTPRFHWFS